eukprot:3527108-Pleurochrysis_carterae.AAC.1
MATMFLSAPQSSTPTVSCTVPTLNEGQSKASLKRSPFSLICAHWGRAGEQAGGGSVGGRDTRWGEGGGGFLRSSKDALTDVESFAVGKDAKRRYARGCKEQDKNKTDGRKREKNRACARAEGRKPLFIACRGPRGGEHMRWHMYRAYKWNAHVVCECSTRACVCVRVFACVCLRAYVL